MSLPRMTCGTVSGPQGPESTASKTHRGFAQPRADTVVDVVVVTLVVVVTPPPVGSCPMNSWPNIAGPLPTSTVAVAKPVAASMTVTIPGLVLWTTYACSPVGSTATASGRSSTSTVAATVPVAASITDTVLPVPSPKFAVKTRLPAGSTATPAGDSGNWATV